MRYLFFLLIIFSIAACDEETEEFSIESGQEYFPLEIGKFITYQVDSIVYNPLDGTIIEIDSSTTFAKEIISDTLRGVDNELIYSIDRFERKHDTMDWQLKIVYFSTIKENQALRTEGNFQFIKMTFPLKARTNWDGNALLNPLSIVFVAEESIEIYKGWDYEVDSVDEAETIGDFSFDRVTTITQADSENAIELRRSVEKYAVDIGLVYREMTIFDTQEISEDPWEQKAEKGFILKQTLIDYN